MYLYYLVLWSLNYEILNYFDQLENKPKYAQDTIFVLFMLLMTQTKSKPNIQGVPLDETVLN